MTKKSRLAMIAIMVISIFAAFMLAFLPQANPPQAQSITITAPADMPTDSWSNFTSAPSGSGTSASPFLISSGGELAWLGTYSKRFSAKLVNDLDMSAHLWTPINGYYLNDLDGQNFSINNLRFSSTNGQCALFTAPHNAYIVTVRNLKIKNGYMLVDMDSVNYVVNAGFLFTAPASPVMRLQLSNISVQDCQMELKNFSGEVYAGFIVGGNNSAAFSMDNVSAINCHMQAASSKSSSSNQYFGMLSGRMHTTYSHTNKNLVATGSIEASSLTTSSPYISGLYSSYVGIFNQNCLANVQKSFTGTKSPVLIDFSYADNNSYRNFDNECADVETPLTTIPSYLDRTAWSTPDPTSTAFTSIFPNNIYFIEYYGLTPNFENVEFWKNYGKKPQGAGTLASPWQIETAENLAYFSSITNIATFYAELKNDIDLSGKFWTPIAFPRSTKITGSFNGNGYTISGMTIDVSYANCQSLLAGESNCYVGLFANPGASTSNFSFLNLKISNFSVTGAIAKPYIYIGILCGVNYTTASTDNQSSAGKFSSIFIVDSNIEIDLYDTDARVSTFGYASVMEDSGAINCDISINDFSNNIIKPLEVNGLSCLNGPSALFDNCFYQGDITCSITNNIVIGTKTVVVGGLTKSSSSNIKNSIFSGNLTCRALAGNVQSFYCEINSFNNGASSQGISCMSANATIQGAANITEAQYHNLTELPTEFDFNVWSAADPTSTSWPYIFIKNQFFMDYYSLTPTLPTNIWVAHTLEPAGNGSQSAPYLISSPENLAWISRQYFDGAIVNQYLHISIQNDLDLSGFKWVEIGSESFPFKGVIEGNGHTISNMDVGFAPSNYVGLIGYLKGDVTSSPNVTYEYSYISNLNLTSATVTGSKYVGGLIGQGNLCKLKNVSVDAQITATDLAGGFVGWATNTFIYENCKSAGNLTCTGGIAGGFSGSAMSFTVKNCQNNMAVSGKYAGGFAGESKGTSYAYSSKNSANITGSEQGGGFCGTNGTSAYLNAYDSINEGTIFGTSYAGGILGDGLLNATNCENKNTVRSGSASGQSAGGIAGRGRNAILRNCTNRATVSGGERSGGMVGNQWQGSAIGCKNYGTITNSFSSSGYIGGIFGYNESNMIKNCINYGQVYGQKVYAGGIVGFYSGSYSVDQRQIVSCLNKGNIDGYYTAGGIVGSGTQTISQCVNAGTVVATNRVGGIVGYGGGTVDTCQNFAPTVRSTFSGSASYLAMGAGGIVGDGGTNTLTIKNCLVNNVEIISNGLNLGGFVGICAGEVSIDSSAFSGKVTGSSSVPTTKGVGGLVGTYNSGNMTVKNCRFEGDITKTTTLYAPLVKSFGGTVAYESCFYNINLYSTASALEGSFKHYVLSASETEETAFSGENWALSELFDATKKPLPKPLVWVGANISGAGVLDWLKANGYSPEV